MQNVSRSLNQPSSEDLDRRDRTPVIFPRQSLDIRENDFSLASRLNSVQYSPHESYDTSSDRLPQVPELTTTDTPSQVIQTQAQLLTSPDETSSRARFYEPADLEKIVDEGRFPGGDEAVPARNIDELSAGLNEIELNNESIPLSQKSGREAGFYKYVTLSFAQMVLIKSSETLRLSTKTRDSLAAISHRR